MHTQFHSRDAIDASARLGSLVRRHRFQNPNSNWLLCSNWPLFC